MKLFVLIYLISFSALSFSPKLPFHLSGHCTPESEDEKSCVYFTPTDLPVEAVREYLKLAKHSIKIATYNMGIPDYADVLNQKARSGVAVEYMVDYKNSFTNKVWPLLDKNNPNLMLYRLPVLRGSGPQMHNKIIIIDDRVLLTGSANYSSFGLIANYENVMAIQKKSLIKKFNSEVEELKSTSLLICAIFGGSEYDCHKGKGVDDHLFHQYLTKGKFESYGINEDVDECWRLSTSEYTDRKALLNSWNNETMKDIHNCFKDNYKEKVKAIVEGMGEIEKYVDNTKTAGVVKPWEKKDFQKGPFKAYFSPEDNIQNVIVRNLEATLKNPESSFAYISTNFINNWTIARSLKKMSKARVRIRAFFDKGRFDDEKGMFQQQLKPLSHLGFFGEPNMVSGVLAKFKANNPHHPSDYRNNITIFHNQLAGPMACNHNKWAIVGTKDKVVLINGSANWSGSAMKRNDENVMIIEDEAIIAIFMKEMVSELFAYRYMQDEHSPQLWDDINFLSSRSSCLKSLLGVENGCRLSNGTNWQPKAKATAVISVGNIPFGEGVYVYSPNLENNSGDKVRAYTHKYFVGNWVTSITAPPNWDMNFHIYVDGTDRGADRKVHLPSIGVHVTRKFSWKQ